MAQTGPDYADFIHPASLLNPSNPTRKPTDNGAMRNNPRVGMMAHVMKANAGLPAEPQLAGELGSPEARLR